MVDFFMACQYAIINLELFHPVFFLTLLIWIYLWKIPTGRKRLNR